MSPVQRRFRSLSSPDAPRGYWLPLFNLTGSPFLVALFSNFLVSLSLSRPAGRFPPRAIQRASSLREPTSRITRLPILGLHRRTYCLPEFSEYLPSRVDTSALQGRQSSPSPLSQQPSKACGHFQTSDVRGGNHLVIELLAGEVPK